MKEFALVTGASSGIGKALAEQLAAQKKNVILVARNEEKLRTTALHLRKLHNIEAEYISADLSKPSSTEYIYRVCQEKKWAVNLLINNAGFGLSGAFLDQEPSRLEDMMNLNMVSVAKMCRTFLPDMVERKGGAIINVASTAAFQPIPYFATYSSTKTFVLYFTEALAAEVARHGVHVMALCPGPTNTQFFEVAGIGNVKLALQPPDLPAQAALEGLRLKRTVVIPGWTNRILAGAARFTPHKLMTSVAARIMQ